MKTSINLFLTIAVLLSVTACAVQKAKKSDCKTVCAPICSE